MLSLGYNGEPVFGFWSDKLSHLTSFDLPGSDKRTTHTRVEPVQAELAFFHGEIDGASSTVCKIDEVECAGLGEAVAGIVVFDVADEGVGVGHFVEGDFFLTEEIERDAAVVPTLVAAAEVLANEIVLRK